MIDLHTHILPGLDDGPPTLAGSVAIARAAVADGTTAVAATPPVNPRFRTTPDQMERALTTLRAALAAAAVPLDVLPGGEIALEPLPTLAPEDLARFGLGGNPRVLLVETPYSGWPTALLGQIVALGDRGIRPVLAHPERNAVVQADRTGLRALVAAGALVQVTAASLDGRLGRRSKAVASALLDEDLVHLVASDAHTPDVRAIGLSSVVHAVDDERLARWLTQEMPAALVAGDPLPPRPPRASKRRFRLFAR